jgi:hypothetical protein
MLNRAGLSMHTAYHERPPWEVEALLMAQVAEREVNRPPTREEINAEDEATLNPPDTPAPAWVDELPTE